MECFNWDLLSSDETAEGTTRMAFTVSGLETPRLGLGSTTVALNEMAIKNKESRLEHFRNLIATAQTGRKMKSDRREMKSLFLFSDK